MANPFQSCLSWIYKKFSENPSGMLIATSALGWTLSSLAQIIAVAVNPKIKEEQKVFLIPQEFNDAIVNIGAFLLITLLTKSTVSNLFTTGKFAPKSVREFLVKNAKLYGDKIGKIGFDVEKVLAQNGDKQLLRTFNAYKNMGTTIATVGAGIVSASIVTPLLRNRMASKFQKSYIKEFIDKKPETPEVKKSEAPAVNKPEVQTVPQPNFQALQRQALQRAQINRMMSSDPLRI